MAKHSMRRGNNGASIVVLSLLVFACSSPSPTQAPPTASSEDWSGFGELENVLRWTPEQQLRGYRNMDKIYPTRAIPASPNPYSLPEHFVDLTGLSYEFEDETYDMAGFLEANHVVGLLVIKRGEVVVERYAHGVTRDTKWYSFSIAKSVVSLLIGAALQDGYIQSLDAPVTTYLPILAGSLLASEPVTISNVPHLNDVSTTITLLQSMGVEVTFDDKLLHGPVSEVPPIPRHRRRAARRLLWKFWRPSVPGRPCRP